MSVLIYPIINLEKGEVVDSRFLENVMKLTPEFIQLRIKTGDENDFFKNSEKILSTLSKRGLETKLIINDRADIAFKTGAYGVHVGQDDGDVAKIESLYPDLKIGLSTHTLQQIRLANRHNLEYIGFGPVFKTGTKDTGYDPVLTTAEQAAKISEHPIVFIGGINLDNYRELPLAKGRSIALISNIDQFFC